MSYELEITDTPECLTNSSDKLISGKQLLNHYNQSIKDFRLSEETEHRNKSFSECCHRSSRSSSSISQTGGKALKTTRNATLRLKSELFRRRKNRTGLGQLTTRQFIAILRHEIAALELVSHGSLG